MVTLTELREFLQQIDMTLTPWQWDVAERLLTTPAEPEQPQFRMTHDQRVRHFLYSLTGQKTSGHLRVEANRASQYGDLNESWIAAIRVEAAELLDSLYGEAEPVTAARSEQLKRD